MPVSHPLVFKIPPEVWCFRYVFGVQIHHHKVFGSLGPRPTSRVIHITSNQKQKNWSPFSQQKTWWHPPHATDSASGPPAPHKQTRNCCNSLVPRTSSHNLALKKKNLHGWLDLALDDVSYKVPTTKTITKHFWYLKWRNPHLYKLYVSLT